MLMLCPLAWAVPPVWAEPTPLNNEAFLLFLADMVEVDGKLTDPLDMSDDNDIDQESGQIFEQTDSDSSGDNAPNAEEEKDEAI